MTTADNSENALPSPSGPYDGTWTADCANADLAPDIKSTRVSYSFIGNKVTTAFAIYEQPGCQAMRDLQHSVYTYSLNGKVSQSGSEWDRISMTLVHFYRSAHSQAGLTMLNGDGASCGQTFQMWNPVDVLTRSDCPGLVMGSTKGDVSELFFSKAADGALYTLSADASAEPAGPYRR